MVKLPCYGDFALIFIPDKRKPVIITYSQDMYPVTAGRGFRIGVMSFEKKLHKAVIKRGLPSISRKYILSGTLNPILAAESFSFARIAVS